MDTAFNQQSRIIRTERGLTISGTRVTLYDVLDYLRSGYPVKLIRHKLNLTEKQIDVALSYITTNASAVEAEYQETMETREEIYQYWQKRNQEHFANLKKSSRKSEHKLLWEKLEQQKASHLVT